jgi:hypothetical protein
MLFELVSASSVGVPEAGCSDAGNEVDATSEVETSCLPVNAFGAG